MTSADSMNCPACGTKGCPAIRTQRGPRRLPERTPVGPCAECGWCRHTTDMSDFTAATGLCAKCNRPAVGVREWDTIEHLPRPARMPDAEWRFRATMFLAWRNEGASALRQHFEVFADFLREQGSAEEVAARADWRAYANKRSDPKAWWQWTVPAGAGWVFVERVRSDALGSLPAFEFDAINYDRAKLTKSKHNGNWFLCWPPGFVRFTAPLHHDVGRWRVTIQHDRNTEASRPVERVWPGGYTALLCPYEAGSALVTRRGVVREAGPESEDLGLFREVIE